MDGGWRTICCSVLVVWFAFAVIEGARAQSLITDSFIQSQSDFRAKGLISESLVRNAREIFSPFTLLEKPHKVCRSKLISQFWYTSTARARMCRKNPQMVEQMALGIVDALRACQKGMQQRRWNCSTTGVALRKTLQKLSRETAYLSAMTSAGMMRSLATACYRGSVEGCTCQKCKDPLDFAFKMSRKFLSIKSADAANLVVSHNYRTGRLAVRKLAKKHCRCHGVSGSCNFQTCYRKPSSSDVVANHLREKYDSAVKVSVSNGKGRSLHTEGPPPSKTDLVFMDKSINYCRNSRKRFWGSGTSGRVCDVASTGPESCEKLCCNGQFETRSEVRQITCRCSIKGFKFQCDTCEERLSISRCVL